MSGNDSWRPVLEELVARQARARAMGGSERLARHREGGRLDARARIERLCDPDSFLEIGALVGDVPADALVAGVASVNGRPVVVGAEDFTVKGGSVSVGNEDKRLRLVEIAGQERIPFVMLLDSVGARVDNLFVRANRTPAGELQALARLSGLVPTVGIIMGPCAGHSSATASLLDFIVMVEGASLYAAGPKLVEVATGERITKEELGGAQVHTEISGVAHNRAPDDCAALDLVRRYLSFLPSSAWSYPPRSEQAADDTAQRRLDAILDVVPADHRRAYDMHGLVGLLVDRGDVLEIQPDYGRSILTTLARLGGRPVAIIANQPAARAGAIDASAAVKAAHFMELADAFHLPVVFLVDTPGILAGSAAERGGVLRAAARMFAVQSGLRVPKFHVTVRKAYGFGGAVMALMPFSDQILSFSFPGSRLAGMPPAGAGRATGDEETEARLKRDEAGSGYRSVAALWYDDVIDPRELRNVLLAGLQLAGARQAAPPEPARRSRITP